MVLSCGLLSYLSFFKDCLLWTVFGMSDSSLLSIPFFMDFWNLGFKRMLLFKKKEKENPS